MTNQEAIKELSYIVDEMPSMECGDWKEAIQIDIEASQQELSGDCISRQETLKVLMDEWTEFDSELMDYLIEKVRKLPSVTPQPKMGQWIYRKEEDSYRCSLCTFPCHKDNLGAIPTKYCAGCGAKMSENPTGSERNEK